MAKLSTLEFSIITVFPTIITIMYLIKIITGITLNFIQSSIIFVLFYLYGGYYLIKRTNEIRNLEKLENSIITKEK